ncbi:hypothetical protein TRE132_52540 [Pseudomonas chlororaphis subsp. aurantiaca]|nr:hypothetical protein TRE132_52540 [Pseudomonas chlororaphis subsp. aurantiaca]
MLKYMLDTNICIFTIKNKPERVREAFNRQHGRLCISSVTLMELIYGAEKSAAPERNLSVIEGSWHVWKCSRMTTKLLFTAVSCVPSWPGLVRQ